MNQLLLNIMYVCQNMTWEVEDDPIAWNQNKVWEAEREVN